MFDDVLAAGYTLLVLAAVKRLLLMNALAKKVATALIARRRDARRPPNRAPAAGWRRS